VIKNGLVGAAVPIVPIAGAGEPVGNIIYCHVVPGPMLVHPKFIEVGVIVIPVKAVGFGQGGGGAHVTLATHPAAVTVALVTNTKVKQPLAALEVKEGGKAVPEKVPNKALGVTTLPS
jgi:hypothetical protein